jgi:hypothetical protein
MARGQEASKEALIMAMSTDKKLYVAVGVLALLGGVFYFQKKQQTQEAASYTPEGRQAELPKIEIGDEESKKIDKITITQPPGDAGKAKDVTLVKQGETWRVKEPIEAEANQTNVTSLLGNLKTLKVVEQISSNPEQYAKYGVTDDKALHAVFWQGDKPVVDLHFGQSGSRGQMTRIAGQDGVYATKGYSSYLYARDTKDWRDRTVFKFEDTKVNSVQIANEHGAFDFAKQAEKWAGKFRKGKAGALAPIKNFDESKVADMLRAFKGLNADAFNEDGKPSSELGLDQPAATVTITLDDGAKRVLQLGGTAEGSSRWAKKEGSEEAFSIGSFAADWALAEQSKFQKSEKDDKAKDEPPGMPPGMGMPGMGMPPGMGHGEDDGHGH